MSMRWANLPVPGLVLLLALAACTDTQISTADNNGTAAMNSGHATEAVRDYRTALARAQAQDDGSAIATTGTNLAIAELADNKPREALTDARALQAELKRRGRTPPPTLDLVIATALYRIGDMPGTEAAAETVAALPNQAIALRGRFLMGLAADAQHDTASLLAAALVLDSRNDPVSAADATELRARLALARGEASSARAQAMAAVKLRTELGDDRGVARCAALAADAATASGAPADAAELYLRAGQGAAAVGDDREARAWLGKAQSMTKDATVAREAALALANLSG
jgi:hypothetical protein